MRQQQEEKLGEEVEEMEEEVEKTVCVTYSLVPGSPGQGRSDSRENFLLSIFWSSLSLMKTLENFQRWALANKQSSEQSFYLKPGLGEP